MNVEKLLLVGVLVSCAQDSGPAKGPGRDLDSGGVTDSAPDDDVDTEPPGTALPSEVSRDSGRGVSDELVDAVGTAQRAFALDLYREIVASGAGDSGASFVYSPYSVSMALSMTLAGAEGATYDQLAAVMHLSEIDPLEIDPALNAMDLTLTRRANDCAALSDGENSCEITIVNQGFVSCEAEVQEAYRDLLARSYGATMYQLDFFRDPDGAVDQINAWISDITHEEIPELLAYGDITKGSLLVLINALYFAVSWKEPFFEDSTEEGSFTELDGSVSTAMMMQGTFDRATYAEGSGWQLVELPYLGGSFSMSLLVPDPGRYLEVEGELDQEFLDTALASLTGTPLFLTMPRFRVEFQTDFVEALQRLGASDLFVPGLADLSGISGASSSSSPLYVTDVMQDAIMEVDEQGTIAAAATAVIVEGEGEGEPDFTEVVIDRPFIMMIRQKDTGALLFVGRVMRP